MRHQVILIASQYLTACFEPPRPTGKEAEKNGNQGWGPPEASHGGPGRHSKVLPLLAGPPPSHRSYSPRIRRRRSTMRGALSTLVRMSASWSQPGTYASCTVPAAICSRT